MGIENEKPDLRFDMKGAILKRDAAYTSGEKRCNPFGREALQHESWSKKFTEQKIRDYFEVLPTQGQNFYFKDKLREEKAMSHPHSS